MARESLDVYIDADIDRAFLEDFAAFSNIGARGGGIERLAASQADGAVRDLLSRRMTEFGLHERTDAVGNQFGFLNPPDDSTYILTGSHLDSQPEGGRFDGQLGVLSSLYALRYLRVHDGPGPRHNVAVVNWTNEEGARFQPSVLGSSVFAEGLAPDAVLKTEDRDGISLREALSDINYLGDDQVPLPAAYVELHVEQGAILDETKTDIGLVENSWAARKVGLVIRGVQTHTGPTPMDRRVDAMYGASKIIVAVRDIAMSIGEGFHANAGYVQAHPMSPNTTPSSVTLAIELRSDSPAKIERAYSRLKDALRDTAGVSGVQVGIEYDETRSSLNFSEEICSIGAGVAESYALRHRRMSTIAGHDALGLARVVPSGLIFVPSVGGVTHNPSEFTKPEDMLNGLHVLYGTLRELRHAN